MDFIKLKYEVLTFFSKIKKNRHEKIKRKKTSNYLEKLRKVDNRTVLRNSQEIRLFGVLRNESLRLPYFFQYYKQMGVDRFFLIDNNSVDNSSAIILKEDKTHLFFTNESYINHWQWIELFLERFGLGHWCLVVDIDELFAYPNFEIVKLPYLISYLENNNYEAIKCFLLDLYPKNLISDKKNFTIEELNYFDTDYYESDFQFLNRKNKGQYSFKIFEGGMRERVFGKTKPPHILSKVPLFKYSSKTYLSQGMHAIANNELADIQGVVFHTKFLSDFNKEVVEETKRGQHYGNGFYYKHYLETIRKNKQLTFFNDESIKYKDSKQLVDLDLMKTNDNFENFCKNHNI